MKIIIAILGLSIINAYADDYSSPVVNYCKGKSINSLLIDNSHFWYNPFCYNQKPYLLEVTPYDKNRIDVKLYNYLDVRNKQLIFATTVKEKQKYCQESFGCCSVTLNTTAYSIFDKKIESVTVVFESN